MAAPHPNADDVLAEIKVRGNTAHLPVTRAGQVRVIREVLEAIRRLELRGNGDPIGELMTR